MIRSLFSAALVVLLTAALAWGNCMSCTDLIPVEAKTHDCCDTERPPTPPAAPKDCSGKAVDFGKADQAKAPVIQTDAGSVLPGAPVVDPQPHVFVTHTPAATHSSLLASPLRI